MRHSKHTVHIFIQWSTLFCFWVCSVYRYSYLVVALVSASGCYKKNPDVKPYVKTPQPWEYMTNEELPKSYDPRDINGVSYVSVTKNQHIPQYCGSCWAFSAASAISDRLRLMTKGAWPTQELSPQVIVNCADTASGCHGGDMLSAYRMMKEMGEIGRASCRERVFRAV